MQKTIIINTAKYFDSNFGETNALIHRRKYYTQHEAKMISIFNKMVKMCEKQKIRIPFTVKFTHIHSGLIVSAWCCC